MLLCGITATSQQHHRSRPAQLNHANILNDVILGDKFNAPFTGDLLDIFMQLNLEVNLLVLHCSCWCFLVPLK